MRIVAYQAAPHKKKGLTNIFQNKNSILTLGCDSVRKKTDEQDSE